MALLSDLVRVVAKVEGLEEVSVGIFARHAREAGLISQGGRGRSAAQMTVRDAANLLIAVNGCSLAKNVPEAVHAIRSLPSAWIKRAGKSERIQSTSHFGDDFERLIADFIEEKLAATSAQMLPNKSVRFYRPEIRADIRTTHFEKNDYVEEIVEYFDFDTEPGLDDPDRSDETVITSRTIRAVARAL